MVRITPNTDHNNRNRCSGMSPPSSFDDDTFPRSFSYYKLPQQHLVLSVLKLDGSSFDVHIARNATVSELKLAVEGVFTSSPTEDQAKISWSHVWGHFCLCYEGQKLVNEKELIRNLGIKDGDQLQFIHHMSINYRAARKRSKKHTSTSRKYSMSLKGASTCGEMEQTGADFSNDDIEHQEDISDHQHDEDEEIPVPECKLAYFIKGRLSYGKFWGSRRRSSGGRTRSSRFSLHFYRSRHSMTQL